MIKSKWKKTALVLFAVSQLLVFAACGNQEAATTGEELTIYGQVTAIEGNNITLALGTLNDMTQPQPPDSAGSDTTNLSAETLDSTEGAAGPGGTPPEGAPQPDGTAPGGTTPPDGNPPQDMALPSAEPSKEATEDAKQAPNTETPDSTTTDSTEKTEDDASDTSEKTSDTPQEGADPSSKSESGFNMLTLTGEEKIITVEDESIIIKTANGTETGLASIQVGDTLVIKYIKNQDNSETLISIEKMNGNPQRDGTAPPTEEDTSYAPQGDGMKNLSEPLGANQEVNPENLISVESTNNISSAFANCTNIAAFHDAGMRENFFRNIPVV